MPILRVRGELDLATAPRVCRAIATAAAAALPPAVVIDLENLEFCDSTGLRALLGAVREVQALGGTAVLVVAPDGAVDRLLSLCGLREFLHVERSPAAALCRLTDGRRAPAPMM